MIVTVPFFARSEEHTSDSSHGYISYAGFCLKKKRGIRATEPPLLPRQRTELHIQHDQTPPTTSTRRLSGRQTTQRQTLNHICYRDTGDGSNSRTHTTPPA